MPRHTQSTWARRQATRPARRLAHQITSMASHVQAKFSTKQTQYAVPDNAISVPATAGLPELSALINSLLSPDQPESQHIKFDFLVEGIFLRSSIGVHLEEKQIAPESIVSIEYLESAPSPEPEDSFDHDEWVSAVHARNDFVLTGSYDNTVRIWNTEGDSLVTIPAHSGPVKSVHWLRNDDDSNDTVARFVTGAHDGKALLWQWNRGTNDVQCTHSCRGHAGSVDCIGVNEDNTKFCTGSSDKMLKIWSAEPSQGEEPEDTGEKPSKRKRSEGKVPTRLPLATISGHKEFVTSSLWIAPSEIATSSWDHTIKLWDLEQGIEKRTLPGGKAIFDMSYSPLNNMLIAASADRHIRMYDPRNTELSIVSRTFTSHTAWVVGVAWSPIDEYKFLSGSHDCTVKLWDTRSPRAPLFDLSGHEDKVMCVDWSMPQYLMSGGYDNALKIFRYMDKDSRGLHMDS